MSADITFDFTKTAKISGRGYSDLTGAKLKAFAAAIPDNATLQLKEAKSYPNEPGISPWEIKATWKEDFDPYPVDPHSRDEEDRREMQGT